MKHLIETVIINRAIHQSSEVTGKIVNNQVIYTFSGQIIDTPLPACHIESTAVKESLISGYLVGLGIGLSAFASEIPQLISIILPSIIVGLDIRINLAKFPTQRLLCACENAEQLIEKQHTATIIDMSPIGQTDSHLLLLPK